MVPISFGQHTVSQFKVYATSIPNLGTAEARRISVSLLGSDVRTMEKILDEGFWTHATNLDPDTYVPPIMRDNQRVVTCRLGAKPRAFTFRLASRLDSENAESNKSHRNMV